MNDSDLEWNFRSFRRRFWVPYGLKMPLHTAVSFVEEMPESHGFTAEENAQLEGLARRYDDGRWAIFVSDKFSCLYNHAKICLLHEMAHISVTIRYGRTAKHGPKFHAEICRLFAVGAYRELL